MSSDPEIAQLVDIIDRAYNKRSWHGTNLRGAIRGVTAAQAAWRPAPGRHNVWELVVHAAYWKYAVCRRFTGERRSGFAREGSNWFPRPEQRPTEDAWRADVALLDRTHRQLRDTIAGLSSQVLRAPASGGSTTAFDLIAGIAAHDLYHAGQIQLLKRLSAGRFV
jgi:hypothetical protein